MGAGEMLVGRGRELRAVTAVLDRVGSGSAGSARAAEER